MNWASITRNKPQERSYQTKRARKVKDDCSSSSGSGSSRRRSITRDSIRDGPLLIIITGFIVHVERGLLFIARSIDLRGVPFTLGYVWIAYPGLLFFRLLIFGKKLNTRFCGGHIVTALNVLICDTFVTAARFHAPEMLLTCVLIFFICH